MTGATLNYRRARGERRAAALGVQRVAKRQYPRQPVGARERVLVGRGAGRGADRRRERILERVLVVWW